MAPRAHRREDPTAMAEGVPADPTDPTASSRLWPSPQCPRGVQRRGTDSASAGTGTKGRGGDGLRSTYTLPREAMQMDLSVHPPRSCDWPIGQSAMHIQRDRQCHVSNMRASIHVSSAMPSCFWLAA